MSVIPVLGIDPTQVHDKQQFRLGQLGAVIGQPTKLYKYVQFVSLFVSGSSGDVCYYNNLDGYKNNHVTPDLSAAATDFTDKAVGAGVIQASVDTFSFDHIWIQIRGPATLSTALTGGSDGDPLTPTGASDKTLDVSAAFTDHVCGIACDASDKEIICMFPY
tara:strand:+ start:546 stop:1031 length:486 start_codon:yes stop_codon:yes gene_type:complete